MVNDTVQLQLKKQGLMLQSYLAGIECRAKAADNNIQRLERIRHALQKDLDAKVMPFFFLGALSARIEHFSPKRWISIRKSWKEMCEKDAQQKMISSRLPRFNRLNGPRPTRSSTFLTFLEYFL